MTANWDAHVHKHGLITQLAPNLWTVKGSLPRGNLPRNMVIYKLRDGGLLIHSAIALDASGMKTLEALGQPKILIVPSRFHRLDAAAYKARYPQLKVLCPKSAHEHVTKKVAVDGFCEDVLPSLGVPFHAPDGIKPSELCYEFDTEAGKALVVTDLFFNVEHGKGVDGFMLKVLGSTGFFGMTRIGRLFMLKDKATFKAWIEKLSKRSDIRCVCVGHGNHITENTQQMLKQAADRL